MGARAEQQDAFGFTDKDDEDFVRHGGVVAVVADGMGGHAHGGEVSRIAVMVFLQEYMTKPEHKPIPDALHQAFNAANRAVCAFAAESGEAGNCGTTLTVAAVHPASRTLHWIATGDSRLFLYRQPQWVQVTTDTNYGNQLLTNLIHGIPTDFVKDDDPQLQGLTSFLGLAELEEIDQSISGFTLYPNDWIVLCTDGVYNTLAKDEIVNCLTGDPNPACEQIIEGVSAKNLKYQDNATVAIIACGFNSGSNQAASKVSKKRPLIIKLALGLLLAMAIVLTFSLGAYVGQSCGSATQIGFWVHVQSTLACLEGKLRLK